MTILLFANQAQTILSEPVASTDLTITVASGTGVYFPQPTEGQGFLLTITDAYNQLINEIVLVTNIDGDVFTILRGQENTIPKTWQIGDFCTNVLTAGTLNSFPQSGYSAYSGYSGFTAPTYASTHLPLTENITFENVELLFSNQAQTTLALPITSTSTTVTVASGTGVYFPTPSTGQAFKFTLTDPYNELITEILLVTHKEGDVFTVVRGDENTIARSWELGTYAANLLTAGSLANFTQIPVTSGYSGYSGTSGFSGCSGINGSSGFS